MYQISLFDYNSKLQKHRISSLEGALEINVKIYPLIPQMRTLNLVCGSCLWQHWDWNICLWLSNCAPQKRPARG